jgi:hypothetical protein
MCAGNLAKVVAEFGPFLGKHGCTFDNAAVRKRQNDII